MTGTEVSAMKNNRRLPIGMQSFAKLREGGYAYADKTRYIYELVSGSQQYFLSRPRRFGKSLFLSTLKAYWEGRKELFEGLEIAELEAQRDNPWQPYPVFYFDFNGKNYQQDTALESILDKMLRQWENTYGGDASRPLEERFQYLLTAAAQKTGRRCVVLVDEYDKPLLEVLGNTALEEHNKAVFKGFFGTLKSYDDYLQFVFITGVTKFSKVSIFSDLNQLRDISLSEKFTDICGITEEELNDCFSAEITALAQHKHISPNECLLALKKNYDGYHFREDSVGMYNPFSLLNALQKMEFKDYWFETGTPTFLVETLKQNNYELENMTREEVTADLLGSLDSIDQNPLPLLYQSGYLTIKDYNPDFGTYTLGFPNGEVERGFTRFLFRHYAPIKIYESDSFVKNFTIEVRNGQPEKFMPRLEALYAGQDYQLVGDTELYFHNVTSLVFKMLGFYTDVERHTTDGRMDMLVQTKDYIYIFEFKIDKSADEALKQIEEKQYAKPFETDSRKLYKIGVNFSSTTRRIEGWKMTAS